jgi:hypothetical protein
MLSETHKTLIDKWGVLLNYEALAQVMNRSPDGLRLSLARGGSDWIQKINAAKVQIGRRVLFRTHAIADLIDGNSAASEKPPVIGVSTTTVQRRPRGQSAA